MTENETHSTFAGKQQSSELSILAFIMAGLFGTRPSPRASGAPREHTARESVGDDAEVLDGYAVDTDTAAGVPDRLKFNWAAYRSCGMTRQLTSL